MSAQTDFAGDQCRSVMSIRPEQLPYAIRELAFRNAARIMKETDCGAVKLEGGRRMAETIDFLVQRGIPVMAHVGLTPQSVSFMMRAALRKATDGLSS